jgi:alanine racemase
MTPYPVKEIASAVSGILEGPGNSIIRAVITDSRSHLSPAGSMFVAMTGPRHDGHRYIEELYRKGVRCFLVSEAWKSPQAYTDADIIRVKDPLRALQDLAAWHRAKYSCEVIGITGSNGKTIIKEWLHQCLQEKWNITRSPKSYNSQLGVPLSVLLLDEYSELGIFEAGISKPGEMKHLQAVIRPSLGIFTNAGEAHQENFTGLEHKIMEKLRLFHGSKVLICCKDHKPIWRKVGRFAEINHVKLVTWSFFEDADLKVIRMQKKIRNTTFEGIYHGHPVEVNIPFSDDASCENAMHVWLTMLHLGLKPDYIRQKLADLIPVAMRLEQKSGLNNCILINDSYNADINSLAIALDVLNRSVQHPKRTLILSDIMQSGLTTGDLYKRVSELLKEKRVNRIIGIGPEINASSRLFSIPGTFYQNSADFIRDIHSHQFSNETILLKGSRSFEFEKISALLEQQVHATRLEINLDALVHNLNYYRSLVPEETRIMVMVKALSYGSGTHEIASLLQYQKVDYLGVAFADEGSGLREAGITLPIMVMNPEPGSFDTLLKYQLEPEIYSFRMLDMFNQALVRHQEVGFPIHIKIDTGMHRLGFQPEEIPVLIRQLKSQPNIRVISVLSHLAASDEEVHDAFTHKQIEDFRFLSGQIADALGYQVIRHILNSGGIERFPGACFDMVRLGIGLYGITSHSRQKLRNVSSLKSQISQIKTVGTGETIGYGRAGKAAEQKSIAIIPIGYADGLDRKLGNGTGHFVVNGSNAPVIGNICMDMTMIDVTGVDAREGDEVIIFDDNHPVTDMATKLGTIPYEILTGISSRVKRVFFHE